MAELRSYNATGNPVDSALATNKVLRNTYWLLGMTLLFSAGTASLAVTMGLGRGAALVCSLLALGIVFFIGRFANSSKGIGLVFAFTGLMGASLGPLLDHYLKMANGSQLIMQALGATAVVFFSLSAYVLTTRKDFSFMRGFLFVGLIVVVLAVIANIFFQSATAHLALSAAIALLMSGFILFDTSRIVNGGETNYIMATVSLYLNVYNLFVSLLQLMGFFGGEE
jgi:modulator of FtsH protease